MSAIAVVKSPLTVETQARGVREETARDVRILIYIPFCRNSRLGRRREYEHFSL